MIYFSGVDPSSIRPHEISLIAQAWIKQYEKEKLDYEHPVIFPPDNKILVDDLMLDFVKYNPEKVFLVIDEILLKTDNKDVLCNLAAGPLEDLLRFYGETVMPQIEERIRKSAKFRDLIFGVYPYSFPGLWKRIESLVEEVESVGKNS